MYPDVAGATNWWPPSFGRQLGVLFLPIRDGGNIDHRDPTLPTDSGLYLGGRALDIPDDEHGVTVAALDLASGSVRWKTQARAQDCQAISGLLSVADSLVLGAQRSTFFGLEAPTGERVWQTILGATVLGAQIVLRYGGSVRVVVAAGAVLFLFAVAAM